MQSYVNYTISFFRNIAPLVPRVKERKKKKNKKRKKFTSHARREKTYKTEILTLKVVMTCVIK